LPRPVQLFQVPLWLIQSHARSYCNDDLWRVTIVRILDSAEGGGVHDRYSFSYYLFFPSPRTMATKRKRNDDKLVINSADTLKIVLLSAITSHASTELGLLHIMKTYDFDTSTLQLILKGPPTVHSLLFFGADWVRIASRGSNKCQLL
jgi:hypothetical protein